MTDNGRSPRAPTDADGATGADGLSGRGVSRHLLRDTDARDPLPAAVVPLQRVADRSQRRDGNGRHVESPTVARHGSGRSVAADEGGRAGGGRAGGAGQRVSASDVWVACPRAMTTVGAILVGLVVWAVLGTALLEGRAQRHLVAGLDRLLPRQAGSPGGVSTPLSPVVPGGSVALLDIPRIGLHEAVLRGIGRETLARGPGVAPVPPGLAGVEVIVGHRTIDGAPFRHLGDVRPGDEVTLTTAAGAAHFAVTGRPETAAQIRLRPVNGSLVLVTANPPYGAHHVLVVTAVGMATIQGDAGRPVGVPLRVLDPAMGALAVAGLIGVALVVACLVREIVRPAGATMRWTWRFGLGVGVVLLYREAVAGLPLAL